MSKEKKLEAWITVAEAAELAGMHLTTMYDRVKDGSIRSMMSNESRPKVLVSFESLVEYMDANPQKEGKRFRAKKPVPTASSRRRTARAAKVAEEAEQEEGDEPVVEVLSKETKALLKAVADSKWKSNRGDVGKAIQKWRKAGMPDVPALRCNECGRILEKD